MISYAPFKKTINEKTSLVSYCSRAATRLNHNARNFLFLLGSFGLMFFCFPVKINSFLLPVLFSRFPRLVNCLLVFDWLVGVSSTGSSDLFSVIFASSDLDLRDLLFLAAINWEPKGLHPPTFFVILPPEHLVLQRRRGECKEHGTIHVISSDFGDRMTTQHLD